MSLSYVAICYGLLQVAILCYGLLQVAICYDMLQVAPIQGWGCGMSSGMSSNSLCIVWLGRLCFLCQVPVRRSPLVVASFPFQPCDQPTHCSWAFAMSNLFQDVLERRRTSALRTRSLLNIPMICPIYNCHERYITPLARTTPNQDRVRMQRHCRQVANVDVQLLTARSTTKQFGASWKRATEMDDLHPMTRKMSTR